MPDYGGLGRDGGLERDGGLGRDGGLWWTHDSPTA